MAEKRNAPPPKGPAARMGPKPEFKPEVLKRVLKYVFKDYGIHFAIVIICIIITAFSTLNGMLFMQSLIDDYIVPMVDGRIATFLPLIDPVIFEVVYKVVCSNEINALSCAATL